MRKLLTLEQERALIARMQNEDDKRDADRARDELIRWHEPLFQTQARKATEWGLELEDALQEARLAGIYALRKFNADKNSRVSTYMGFWIHEHLSVLARQSSGHISTPRSGLPRRDIIKWSRAKKEFALLNNRDPDAVERAEICAGIGIDERTIIAYEIASVPAVRLDSTTNDEDGTQRIAISDSIADSNADTDDIILDRLQDSRRKTALEICKGSMNGLEREIYETHILASKPASLKAISKKHRIGLDEVEQARFRVMLDVALALNADNLI